MTVSKNRLLSMGMGLLMGSISSSVALADSLEDVVHQALATNPRMSKFLNNRESIDYELRRDQGLFLPQVDVAAGVGYQAYSSPATRASGTSTDFLDRTEYSIIVSQRIFDGYDAASRVGKQEARAASAASRVFENAEVLALDAVVSYVDVYLQRELVKLAQANVDIHLEILESLKERTESGGGSIADVAQAEARRARSMATLLQTQNDLRDVEAGYRRVVGEVAADVDSPELPAEGIPQSWEDAQELVRGNSPTTKIFENEIAVAKKDIDIADAPFYPNVNLEAGYSYQHDADGVEDETQDWSAMLRLRWNLYRGGSDLAIKRAAIARLMQARNQRYEAANEVLEEMRISWNAFELSKERVAVLQEANQFNQETVELYRQQFEVAQRSLLDVLDAENELFVTKGQLLSAEINVVKAAYRLLAAGGLLLSTLGVEVPQQSVVSGTGYEAQTTWNPLMED